jgi:hypothetical protein
MRQRPCVFQSISSRLLLLSTNEKRGVAVALRTVPTLAYVTTPLRPLYRSSVQQDQNDSYVSSSCSGCCGCLRFLLLLLLLRWPNIVGGIERSDKAVGMVSTKIGFETTVMLGNTLGRGFQTGNIPTQYQHHLFTVIMIRMPSYGGWGGYSVAPPPLAIDRKMLCLLFRYVPRHVLVRYCARFKRR